MAGRKLPFFDASADPIDERIATGLHKIGLAIKHQTWVAANEDGLSPTQGQILAALASDGALSGSEVSKRLGIGLPTISESARALVDKGLVEKSADPRHPRASLLSLTAAGKRRAASTRAWPEYLAGAVGALSADEQRAFYSGLVKMITTLQEDGRIPVGRMCVSCVHFRPRVHEGPMPHHCAFVDAPMAERHLRIDCKEHEEAAPSARADAAARFLRHD